jgi:muconate cycloisomerase
VAVNACTSAESGMADIADTAGVPCWHGSEVDLGILEASYLHACAAARNCTKRSDILGELVRKDDLIFESLEITDGLARVLQKPGLGVDLDLKAVQKVSRDVTRQMPT